MKYLTPKELLFELKDVIHNIDYKSLKEFLNKKYIERLYNKDKLSPINQLHILSCEISGGLNFKHDDVLLNFGNHEDQMYDYVIIAKRGEFYRWKNEFKTNTI